MTGSAYYAAARLRPDAGAYRDGMIPALQRRMLVADRKAGSLGREVGGDDGGNVGNREFISRYKRNIGEPGIEVSVEISDALPASLDQRRDLIVVIRTGDGPVLETGDGVANRFHHRSKSFQLNAPFPHRDQRLGLRRRSEQRRFGIDFLEITQDGWHFADRSAVLQHQGRNDAARVD